MKPKEWIFVAILVLDLVLLAIFLRGKADITANAVTVSVDGEQVGTYPLYRSTQQPVAGHDGFSLLLVISNGQAFVKESSCPDLICQQHAAISRAGEQIVCLPARVVITVTGEENEIDAVTQ